MSVTMMMIEMSVKWHDMVLGDGGGELAALG
jgi:hypothetical protein